MEGSLQRLHTDHIDLYIQHRIDPNVEPETVAQTMAELIREGKILHWGISEADEAYLRQAHKVCPPLANGLLSACYNAQTRFDAQTDFRSTMPQFSAESFEKNRHLFALVNRLADAHHATPAQVSLAWMLCKKPWIVPIPGTRRPDRLQENAAAADIALTEEEVEQIDRTLDAMPMSGVYGGTKAATA